MGYIWSIEDIFYDLLESRIKWFKDLIVIICFYRKIFVIIVLIFLSKF